MKKIKLLISLVLINFYAYSQTIPTAEEFLNFLQENNSKCGSIDEDTLRWKSDDGRFEKVFNYVFIPEE